MSAQVRTTVRADAEVLAITAWWGAHRAAAPYLFEDELAEVFDLLKAQPEAGRLVPRPRFPKLRRVALRKSRHLVFYDFDETQGVVWVRSRRRGRAGGHRRRTPRRRSC